MYLELYADSAIDCVCSLSPASFNARRAVDIGEQCLTCFVCEAKEGSVLEVFDGLVSQMESITVFYGASTVIDWILAGKNIVIPAGDKFVVVGLNNLFDKGPLLVAPESSLGLTNVGMTLLVPDPDADKGYQKFLWCLPDSLAKVFTDYVRSYQDRPTTKPKNEWAYPG